MNEITRVQWLLFRYVFLTFREPFSTINLESLEIKENRTVENTTNQTSERFVSRETNNLPVISIVGHFAQYFIYFY